MITSLYIEDNLPFIKMRITHNGKSSGYISFVTGGGVFLVLILFYFRTKLLLHVFRKFLEQ